MKLLLLFLMLSIFPNPNPPVEEETIIIAVDENNRVQIVDHHVHDDEQKIRCKKCEIIAFVISTLGAAVITGSIVLIVNYAK